MFAMKKWKFIGWNFKKNMWKEIFVILIRKSFIWMYVFVCMCECVYVYPYVYEYELVYECVYMYDSMCMYVCMYVCMCARVCICVYERWVKENLMNVVFVFNRLWRTGYHRKNWIRRLKFWMRLNAMSDMVCFLLMEGKFRKHLSINIFEYPDIPYLK